MPQPAHERTYANNAAENYERYFVPVIGAPVAADLVDVAALRSGERVLDVACGTGIVTRLAAERVGLNGTVAGLDINPGMLATARAAAPPGRSIVWYESSADAIPLPDGGFDVVLCGMGLQFFSDRSAALREIRRVLAPGGRLVANVPGPIPPLFEILAGALARYVSSETEPFVRAVFSLHDATTLYDLAAEAGFGHVTVQSAIRTLRIPRPEDFLWQYVHSTPLAAAVAKIDDERRAALKRDITTQCQEVVEDGAPVIRVKMTTLTATK
jgi:ubiquinone/menaquinone biosynthesis C-methylase UbiE